jgi:hypothetical protein
MSRSNLLRAAVVVAPVAIFLAVYSVFPPNVPLISPDSDSYLNFAAIRSGGYPFFLAILKPLVRAPSGYAVAQLVLYAFAVLILTSQLLASFRSLLFCLLAELLLLGNWEVNRYHFVILTESVLLSTSALFLATALASLRTGSLLALAAASACAAYAMAIRPTGIIFIATLLLILLMSPGFSRRVSMRLFATAVPLIIVLGGEALYYRAHHSGPRTSLLAIQMLGKAGMVAVANPQQLIDAAPEGSKPLQTALEAGLEPVRNLVANAPGIAARCRLAVNYETFVEYAFALPERAEVVAAAGEGGLTKAAFARLRHGLPDYMRLTGDYFFCLWTFWAAENREKTALATYIDARKPLPFQDEVLPFLATSPSPPFVSVLRAGMLGVAGLFALAGACLLVALGRRRSPGVALAVAGLCGMIVHGGLLLSALGGVGIARYAHGLWVPLAVGLAASIAWIGRWLPPLDVGAGFKPAPTDPHA